MGATRRSFCAAGALLLAGRAGNVVEAVKARQVDLAFVAIDPVRAQEGASVAPKA